MKKKYVIGTITENSTTSAMQRKGPKMAKRIHKKKQPKKREEEQVKEIKPADNKQSREAVEEVDDLIDEIDDLLGEGAEEFVKGYIQKGGQ